jgi:hypothetical protein
MSWNRKERDRKEADLDEERHRGIGVATVFQRA